MKNIYIILTAILFSSTIYYSTAQVTVNADGKLSIATTTNNDNNLSLNQGGQLYDIDVQSGDMTFRPNGSTSDGTYAMKLTDNIGFPVEFYGKANLGVEQTGIILEADGSEALWYTTDHYSWGFGKNWNYFADEILIGNGGASGFTPLNSDGLSIDANKDIRMEGTGSKYIRFTESGAQKAYVGHTGTNMFVRNSETNGDLILDGKSDLLLQSNSATHVIVQEDGQVGIGTINPTEKVQVDVGSSGGVLVEASNYPYVRLKSNGSSEDMTFNFMEGSQYVANIGWEGNDNFLYLNAHTANTAEEQLVLATNGRIGVGHSAPLSDFHIKDEGEVAGIIVERADQNNYVNLLSGSTGNSFYFAQAKRFSVVPSASITSTSPDVDNSLFMYGPNWSNANQQGNMGIGRDAPVEKLDVNGCVRANCYITVSDRRLKSDIDAYGYGLEQVMKLEPVSYKYNGRAGTADGAEHVGLIAQELQKIAPELVEEFTHVKYEYDEDGTQREVGEETYFQVRDSEIKFMLINSIKEIAAENNSLKKEVAELKAIMADIQSKLNSNQEVVVQDVKFNKKAVAINGEIEAALLSQNNPNPFSDFTTIPYFIPEGSMDASIQIFSTDGKLLKTVQIKEQGAGQLNLSAHNLPSGSYVYRLMIDSGVVETKTMILSK